MLKKFASFISRRSEARKYWRVFSVRQDPFYGRTATQSAVGTSLASSLAAALLGTRRVLACQGWAGEKSGLFEHPAWCSPVILDMRISEVPACLQSFSES